MVAAWIETWHCLFFGKTRKKFALAINHKTHINYQNYPLFMGAFNWRLVWSALYAIRVHYPICRTVNHKAQSSARNTNKIQCYFGTRSLDWIVKTFGGVFVDLHLGCNGQPSLSISFFLYSDIVVIFFFCSPFHFSNLYELIEWIDQNHWK